MTVAEQQFVSWQDYLALGENTRAEYVDGKIVMSPSPTRRHQRICVDLMNALSGVLPPGLEVTLQWAWKPKADEFIPDVMVHPQTDEQERFTGMPHLLIEVLSGNRGDDLVSKATKYAVLGVPHYWVVDPRDHLVRTFRLQSQTYVPELVVDGGERTLTAGEVALTLDVDDLLSA